MKLDHDCRCADLPDGWPKCGQRTKSTWSTGCDGRSLDAALRHLGFETRLQFIDWAASRPQGQPGAASQV